MVASVRAWACLAAAVVLAVAPRGSCLPPEIIKPARDSPRALYHPYTSRDTPLASLVETFAQNDLGKGHIFDFDQTLTSDTKPSVPEPPKFNIHTFTFNEKNVRKPGDIFSLLADVKSGAEDEGAKTVSVNQKPEASKPSDEEEVMVKVPGVEVVNAFGKKILMATKDFQDFMGVVQRMKKKVEAKMNTTDHKNSEKNSSKISLASLSSLPSTLTANVSSLVSLLLDTKQLDEIRTAGLTAQTEDEFLDHLTSVLIGGETRSTALTLDPVTIIALLTLGRSRGGGEGGT